MFVFRHIDQKPFLSNESFPKRWHEGYNSFAFQRFLSTFPFFKIVHPSTLFVFWRHCRNSKVRFGNNERSCCNGFKMFQQEWKENLWSWNSPNNTRSIGPQMAFETLQHLCECSFYQRDCLHHLPKPASNQLTPKNKDRLSPKGCHGPRAEKTKQLGLTETINNTKNQILPQQY